MAFKLFLSLVLVVSTAACSTPRFPGESPVRKLASSTSLPLFADSSAVELEIHSNFADISKHRDENASLDAGDQGPKVETPGTIADLAHPDRIFKISLRARGHTSIDAAESDFPKLHGSIDDAESLKGTLFEGNRHFRINTHLNTHPTSDSTPMGRIADERGPYREALAYDIASALGIETPGIRRARITYVDTVSGEKFTKNALLIESDNGKAKSAGATILDPKVLEKSATSGIDSVTGAKFMMYQALISNYDVELRVNEIQRDSTDSYHAIKNAYVLKLSDNTLQPVVYDLDVAGCVVTLAANDPAKLKPAVQSRIAKLFNHFTKSELNSAFKDFLTRKASVDAAIHSAPIDEPGRTVAQTFADLFFQEFNSVMKLDVIAEPNVVLYQDPELKTSMLAPSTMGDGSLHMGAPIVKIIARNKTWLKVQIIDSQGDVANAVYGKPIIGYIPANTKIAPSLTSDQASQIADRDMIF